MEYKNKLIWICLLMLHHALYSQIPAFPGAEGFGATASGGRGGKVIYVTNLNASGPGSLQAAVNESGKRYILFKVSGVIPTTIEVPIGHGDFTIAGQTSPKGIIVRGFLSYNDESPSSGNMIIRHLRSRIGDMYKYPTSNWLAEDGITLGGVHQAIIDHCSFAHASDEAVDISRSSALTIQNCLLAETLGGHSYLGGMLINYSSASSRMDSLSIHHNVWNRIGGRMPEISCESPYCNGKTIKIELSNNLAWDPRIELWYEGPTPGGNFYVDMNAINNLYHAAPNFGNSMYHFDLLNFAKNRLFFSGNKMNLYPNYSDYQLFYCCNDFNTGHPNTNFGSAVRLNARHNFPTIQYHTTAELKSILAASVGAFPRDAMDTRLMNHVKNNTIDSKSIQIDNYNDAFTILNDKQPPLDTDGDGMPDYWEMAQGLNKNIQDHNNQELSNKIYSLSGYTNLECYLNCLSDALVNGTSTTACGIKLDVLNATENHVSDIEISVSPNPATDDIHIALHPTQDHVQVTILDITGKPIIQQLLEPDQPISTRHLNSGIYFIHLNYSDKTAYRSRLVIAR